MVGVLHARKLRTSIDTKSIDLCQCHSLNYCTVVLSTHRKSSFSRLNDTLGGIQPGKSNASTGKKELLRGSVLGVSGGHSAGEVVSFDDIRVNLSIVAI